MNAQSQHPKIMPTTIHFTKPTTIKQGRISEGNSRCRAWVDKEDQRNQARSDRKKRKLLGAEPGKIRSRRYRRYTINNLKDKLDATNRKLAKKNRKSFK